MVGIGTVEDEAIAGLSKERLKPDTRPVSARTRSATHPKVKIDVAQKIRNHAQRVRANEEESSGEETASDDDIEIDLTDVLSEQQSPTPTAPTPSTTNARKTRARKRARTVEGDVDSTPEKKEPKTKVAKKAEEEVTLRRSGRTKKPTTADMLRR